MLISVVPVAFLSWLCFAACGFASLVSRSRKRRKGAASLLGVGRDAQVVEVQLRAGIGLAVGFLNVGDVAVDATGPVADRVGVFEAHRPLGRFRLALLPHLAANQRRLLLL